MGRLSIFAALLLTACFGKKEAAAPSEPPAVEAKVSAPKKQDAAATNKDKDLGKITRYFSQADGIHREAWWVLTSEKKPMQKTPFGKVERALLASENIKLPNKSIFRCDRYVVTRKILNPTGYPQSAEVLEKCSEKQAGKKIADLNIPNVNEVSVTFYPDNLEEILGLGPSILNKRIECTLKANDSEALTSLQCKNWAEDRTKEQMIRLDTYDYAKEGKNLLKLRGKVFENLSDIRKIEADVPMQGKIQVVETELYAPVVKEKPEDKKKKEEGSAVSGVPSKSEGAPDTPAIDPDIQRAQGHGDQVPAAPQVLLPPDQQEPQAQTPAAAASSQGWPLDENGNPITPENLPPEQQQQLMEQQQQQQEMRENPAPIANPNIQPPPQAPGAPHGR